jgi:hypothetical protein
MQHVPISVNSTMVVCPLMAYLTGSQKYVAYVSDLFGIHDGEQGIPALMSATNLCNLT